MRALLLSARSEHGLSTDEIARHLDITPRQYRRLETGASNGSVKVWERLSKILNKPINDLLSTDDRPS